MSCQNLKNFNRTIYQIKPQYVKFSCYPPQMQLRSESPAYINLHFATFLTLIDSIQYNPIEFIVFHGCLRDSGFCDFTSSP